MIEVHGSLASALAQASREVKGHGYAIRSSVVCRDDILHYNVFSWVFASFCFKEDRLETMVAFLYVTTVLLTG